MAGSNNNHLRNCDPQVKALCNKAMDYGHTKCHKQNNGCKMIGSQINIFLSSVLAETYCTESRDGITTAENTVEDDKGYDMRQYKNTD